MNKIYEIFGSNAKEMTIALLGVAEVAKRIPDKATIALKPNLVLCGKAEDGAITHPGVLAGCMEYLQSHGKNNISVIESSWIGDDTDRAFRTAGYGEVCDRYGVPFYDLKKDSTREVDTPFGKIAVCEKALDADFLIDLPVLKGHCQTVMTCAVKNLKGCIPDREKRRFHTAGLMKPIAGLAVALRPDLAIVDSICGDLNFEEGGNPVQTNRMYLGDNAVQVDAYGCRLMGLSIGDVPYLPLAEQWGAGSTDLDDVEIVSLNSPQDTAEHYPKPSGLVKRLTTNVQQDRACSACFASLVRALYTLQKDGIRIKDDIAIGQGWRGKPFHGCGIGNCCAKADTYVKGCPPSAKEVAEFLRGKSSE